MNQVVEAEVVVVGTGPSGAGLARDLALAGRKVAMVEAGGDCPSRGNFSRALAPLGGWRGLLGRRQELLWPNRGWPLSRGASTGGSTMLYWGTAMDPAPEIFRPYGFELVSEAAERCRELGVAPLPESLMAAGVSRIATAARDLGHNWQPLDKFIRPELCKLDCEGCAYGCPSGAKWQARDWVTDAVKRGASLWSHCRCEEVLTRGHEIAGVRTIHRSGGVLEVMAPRVVLAAGGVGSPQIMLNSGIGHAGGPLFCEPFTLTAGVCDEPAGRGPLMCMGARFSDEGILLADLLVPGAILAGLAWAARVAVPPWRFGRTLTIMSKIRDELAGTVNRRGRVDKELSVADCRKLRHGQQRARQILEQAGARDIWNSPAGAWHLGGGCAVGRVVDANLETEIKGLYVCDASVLPAPLGIPPTLTLLALSKRLARHLSAELAG